MALTETKRRYVEAGTVEEREAVFANLPDEDLAASAQFWLSQCDLPHKYERGSLVYDATLLHIIVPELIRRLK